MRFATKAIHVGQEPDPSTGSIVPPVHLTTTYVQEAPCHHKGWDYTRAGNPNFTNLELTLASLEGAKFATVFSSGLGATTAMVSTLQKGDFVLGGDDMYGGTYRLFRQVFEKFGIVFETLNMQDLPAVQKALKKKPKWVFLESPTNPLLKISDIGAIAKMAKEEGVRSIVDNTFASPYFQSPLALGANAVLHSTTKYIGGHSDVVGGVIISNDQTLKEQMDFARKALGLNPSPFDNWLTSRGVKTLEVRMEKHASNAAAVAKFLTEHPKVKKVYFPGLPSHANHEVAKKQMRGFSGMVSVEFHLSLEQAMKLVSSFKWFALAESLGGVESLVDHPATMTHASVPKAEREKVGLGDGLMRFSVGIEDPADLIEDLKIALEKV